MPRRKCVLALFLMCLSPDDLTHIILRTLGMCGRTLCLLDGPRRQRSGAVVQRWWTDGHSILSIQSSAWVLGLLQAVGDSIIAAGASFSSRPVLWCLVSLLCRRDVKCISPGVRNVCRRTFVLGITVFVMDIVFNWRRCFARFCKKNKRKCCVLCKMWSEVSCATGKFPLRGAEESLPRGPRSVLHTCLMD